MVQYDTIKLYRTRGTILATSGVSKRTLIKNHDYSRLFSLEKRRLKRWCDKKCTLDPHIRRYLKSSLRGSVRPDVCCNGLEKIMALKNGIDALPREVSPPIRSFSSFGSFFEQSD